MGKGQSDEKGTGVCKCGVKISFYSKMCLPCTKEDRIKNPRKYKKKDTIDKNIKPYMLRRHSGELNTRTSNSCMSGGEI